MKAITQNVYAEANFAQIFVVHLPIILFNNQNNNLKNTLFKMVHI